MTPIKLYYATASTPSRAVLMAILNMDIEVEVITLNIAAGEHKAEEYSQINPRSIVPTIVDGDFMLWESKAILIYLATKQSGPKHCKGSSLYPKFPTTRALVLQRLLFDSTDFYAGILAIIKTAFGPNPVLTKGHQEALEKSLSVMESFLEGHDYFVGNNLTLADFPFCASVATLTNFGFDISSFENVLAWYERMKEVKGYDQCLSGAEEMGGMVKGCLKNSFADLN